MIRLLAFVAFLLPSVAFGQSWPVYETTYVNDYAGIIEEAAETRIVRQLEVLREDTGVEVTVLTLPTRQGFTPTATMEQFATGLFNHWGIGDASKNDGILIMVLRNDREMRIELGSGYGDGYNREAKYIIDRVFIPAFKEDAYSRGIEEGTDAVINQIALRHWNGEAPKTRISDEAKTFSIVGAVIALIGGWIVFGRRISDRFRRCPSCGQRGVHTHKETLEKATRSRKGRGQRALDCPHCGYHRVTPFVIPMVTSSSSGGGGSFGGGSSSGGGASGSW